MMQIKVITTKDGSKSLYLPEMNETYHSKFGAKTESEHVFIQAGYRYLSRPDIRILEIGFGTGLNVLLTWHEQTLNPKKIYYESLEKYPLPDAVLKDINNFENEAMSAFFNQIHQAPWNKAWALNPNFILYKNHVDIQHFKPKSDFDLIYFDAFAPNKQPEMWTLEIFQKMYDALTESGVLVTYSAKGSVRRTMQAAGFTVERIPGPPGKREMLRAIKK